jgi:hypothetical protein
MCMSTSWYEPGEKPKNNVVSYSDFAKKKYGHLPEVDLEDLTDDNFDEELFPEGWFQRIPMSERAFVATILAGAVAISGTAAIGPKSFQHRIRQVEDWMIGDGGKASNNTHTSSTGQTVHLPTINRT